MKDEESLSFLFFSGENALLAKVGEWAKYYRHLFAQI